MGIFMDLIDQGGLAEDMDHFLNNLSHQSRLNEIRSLNARQLKRLFELAPTGAVMEDLVAKETKPHEPIIFYGKNSLPSFSIFQKRMCRSQDGTHLLGYNHQTMQWVTGPGYFEVHDKTDRKGQIMIDYTYKPQEQVMGWPPIKPNESGISRFVYANMKDYLKRVSEHVFIGSAAKKGKDIGQYFVLSREAAL